MGRARQCDRCNEFYPCSDGWYDGEVVCLRTMKVSCLCGFCQKEAICWDLCPDCTAKLNKWLKGKDFKED
jgi:hypothetical protein